MRQKIQYILLLLAILLIALLSLANMQTVEVNFLFASLKLPLIILILLTALLGALATFLISLPKNFSLKKEIKRLQEERRQEQHSVNQ